jgi:hypothetical protein
MKKLFYFLFLQIIAVLSVNSQPVSEYIYKLDNGITVKSERCWNQVWVQQDYVALQATDKAPLTIVTRTLGDLTSGSSFKLIHEGKEVKLQGAAPGTYNLKLVFKLSGKPGTLSFVVGNVIIKPKTKTTVTITMYDYQILIAEAPAAGKGLASFDLKIIRYKGTTDQSNNPGVPTFFAKGQHDKAIAADETTNSSSGKIKPGVYDVLLSIAVGGQIQKLWLENFNMKADISYNISANLNGGVIAYTGVLKDVKSLRLYPAGTAAKQTGTPAPVKNLEIGNYETVTAANLCAPGTYDVLLGMKNGTKFEWRKNMVIKTGSRAEVK